MQHCENKNHERTLNKNCQAATPVKSSKKAKRLHTAFRIPLE